ncbi:hypothetical protein CFC21_012834 [Triticum aestivum]|uniref:Uncharacterized protein n=4 Tax=Triticinae TaxID=1648030 RepID=A0A452ZEH3_AEGTS|nr:uncharacterized protein LOC109752104 [Aegilops tauschii subsp. strangulata]XP_044450941.1 uncharacterized protein LOC123182446 [Triticum aestivum]KAF6996501.1 hypothetical protein CFC21_012834 [Triticum aestivum]
MEALAVAGGKPLSGARARRIARSREEMLGLLADFDGGDGSDRELSFSDLVDAVRPPPNAGHASVSLPAPVGVEAEAAEQRREDAPPSKKQQQAAGKEKRRLRRRPSDNRGSCGGGADGNGVLLNFYVPGLLTRSMTAPRPGPGRGLMPAAGTRQSAPPTVAAGKTRMQASLDIGCWPALWGRGRDHHRNKPV